MRDRDNLRIWHVLESYPPDYGGGTAITTRDICRFLAKRGHEVRVLCVENANRPCYTIRTEYDGAVRVDRVNLPYFKMHDPDGWQFGLLRWREHEQRIANLFEQMLAEWRPDLVDYHTSRPFGDECLISIARHDVPIVATLHDAYLICPRLNLLDSPVPRPCSRPKPLKCLECLYSHYDGSRAKAAVKLPWRLLKLGVYPAYRLWRRGMARRHVMAAIGRSAFMTQIHQPLLLGPVQHIPLGIDLTDLPAERPIRPRKPLRFGFVAGFQQSKGIWHVLDAAASLKRHGLPFALHIWGPSQEHGDAEIAARGLEDRVFLRGMYAPAERWPVYTEIDVAIMATTHCEPLGRVPMEAAAVGAPTIAPAVGGIPETIRDGVDGLLYRFRDPKHLEHQMRRTLEEPGLVEHLIKNLQPVLDTRSRIPAVEEFYISVLRSRASARATSAQSEARGDSQ
jgi:glycosyltransferase involved in cell wall biosynthesis